MKRLGRSMSEMARGLSRVDLSDGEVRGLGKGPDGQPRGFGIEPRADWIGEIAALDPVSAYGLVLGIPRIPICINASGSFPSTLALGAIPITATIDTTIAQRTWIDNVTYDLQVPNQFQGSVLKTLSDAMLKFSPGVGVALEVQSGPRYVVSEDFTPLENFVNAINSRWTRGWPLFKQQSLLIQFSLTQLPSGSSTGPYNVTMTFNGWQFLDHTVDEVSVDVAARKLREMGFWLPRAVECP